MGGVNYQASIMNCRKFKKVLKSNPHLKISDFKITKLIYANEKYKKDDLNTNQIDLF